MTMMKRRSLLKLGLGAAVVLGVAGAGVAMLKPGLVDGGKKLSPGGRQIFAAVARAVFDGGLLDPRNEAAMKSLLDRLDQNIAVFPAAVRDELSQVLSLLDTAAGRFALIGLKSDWATVPTAELAGVLDALRLSGSNTRQQIYHALRDLCSVAFFTDPANWAAVGYPGPREIP
ncbi:hypothetical protein [Roseateles microcysteis]|uniref:hypothetical protein n=1 Tax=Roseateles microcysteis TaxID=3119057 RepID=UPI002FE6BD91